MLSLFSSTITIFLPKNQMTMLIRIQISIYLMQFITTVIIISISSGRDSAIMIVNATKV